MNKILRSSIRLRSILLTFVSLVTGFALSNNIFFKNTASTNSSDSKPNAATKVFHYQSKENWVDSIINSLTVEEKIGQLIMLRAHSDKSAEYENQVENLIKKYHVGSLCFFQGTPERQAELTNRYQAASKIPLIISMDAEFGLGMRLKESAITYPKNLCLGAIQDNCLIYDLGLEIAKQCQRLGVHLNFSPVCDVNNNPSNPVIHERSFGEDRYNVAAKSYQMMMGLQDGNVFACAKHFPGHGDTDVDSHLDLPVIHHNKHRLDSLELFPFRVLAQQGIKSIMVAHLQVPALDNTVNQPTTLSPIVVNDLLKKEMNFKGLIITDALEMKGVTKHYRNGEVELNALKAGNDILCLPENVDAAINLIKAAIQKKELSIERINESVKKVLVAKYELGLTQTPYVNTQNVRSEVNTEKSLSLKYKILEAALTTVRNDNDILPLSVSGTSISSLSIGSDVKTTFQEMLDNYNEVRHYTCPKNLNAAEREKVMKQLEGSQTVVVFLHRPESKFTNRFGITESSIQLLDSIQQKYKMVLVWSGSPYGLKYFDNYPCVLEAWMDDEMSQKIAAQAVFGAIGTSGLLPVTASPKAKSGDGIFLKPKQILTFGMPELVGLDSRKLNKIDDIVQEAITVRATPGAVVLVAKDNKIVFYKSYGYQTYDYPGIPVNKSDVFDLASITKMASTTLSAMKLYDNGSLQLDSPIENYIPLFKGSDKEKFTIREMMAHHAGLVPWIPFYKKTLTDSIKGGTPSGIFYKNYSDASYQIPVTSKLFLRKDYVDSLWQKIKESQLLRVKAYKYSDLGLIITGKAIENISGKGLDVFAKEQFYQPLSLKTTTYNPLSKYSESKIIPSERDDYFRYQTIQGNVHDMAAAMFGGVSGHAGLFSNAYDLATIMQMLLNQGSYGGQHFLKPETVKLFTTRFQGCTRRGIGFDMKELDATAQRNMASSASEGTFGHLGFTGTVTWADPKNNLILVFLSNRTYPTMNNNKLIQLDTRIRVHQAIYDAMQ